MKKSTLTILAIAAAVGTATLSGSAFALRPGCDAPPCGGGGGRPPGGETAANNLSVPTIMKFGFGSGFANVNCSNPDNSSEPSTPYA